MTAATFSMSSVAALATAGVTVVAFIVGYLIVPRRKERREVLEKAEALRLQTALRDQRLDERIDGLLQVSERHERRLTQLERWLWSGRRRLDRSDDKDDDDESE
jgi:hypothetical protein